MKIRLEHNRSRKRKRVHQIRQESNAVKHNNHYHEILHMLIGCSTKKGYYMVLIGLISLTCYTSLGMYMISSKRFFGALVYDYVLRGSMLVLHAREPIRETSSHATRQGTLIHSRSQLAEPLWTDPGLKNGSGERELISTLKKRRKNKIS